MSDEGFVVGDIGIPFDFVATESLGIGTRIAWTRWFCSVFCCAGSGLI